MKRFWDYFKRRSIVNVVVEIKNDVKGNAETSVNVKAECMTRGELIAAIAANSKLTKADAGRALDAAIESSIKLRGFKAIEPEL